MAVMERRSLGKWNNPDVPHKGWSCVGVEELEELQTCDMCESARIRFGHHMKHPSFDEELIVGCDCAEAMEDDYVNPKLREGKVRNASGRKRRWQSRAWKLSAKGNPYLKTRDGFHVVIWRNPDGTWGGRVNDTHRGREIVSKRRHASEDAVRMAAFHAMEKLKQERELR